MTKEECEIETSKAIMEMRSRIAELEEENEQLQEKLNIRSCQNCKHNNKSCPNDGSCVHYSKWEGYKNPQLTRAKEIIKKLYSHVFQGMGFMEINDYNVQKAEAERFISEVEKLAETTSLKEIKEKSY